MILYPEKSKLIPSIIRVNRRLFLLVFHMNGIGFEVYRIDIRRRNGRLRSLATA